MESLDTQRFMVDTPTDAGQAPLPGASGRSTGAHARRRQSPAFRGETIGLMSISLGTAGLGGTWQSASATVSASFSVSDALFALSALIWVILLVRYLRHGGVRWRNIRDDLHHPGQGFALAYVPIVGILSAGHVSHYDLDLARGLYVFFGAAAAIIAAGLVAHWVTGGLDSAPLHPGYLLPVVSAPFISSITASTLRYPELAAATFAVGILYWLAFGTVILGHLVANGGSMPAPARPTLTVLIIPPATGGLAWTAAHHGVLDPIAYGFVGLLLFTLLIIAFLLPDVRQQSFHYGYWIFSFPVATSTNFLIRWLAGTGTSGWRAATWILLAIVSAVFLLLYASTLRHVLRRPARTVTQEPAPAEIAVV